MSGWLQTAALVSSVLFALEARILRRCCCGCLVLSRFNVTFKQTFGGEGTLLQRAQGRVYPTEAGHLFLCSCEAPAVCRHRGLPRPPGLQVLRCVPLTLHHGKALMARSSPE